MTAQSILKKAAQHMQDRAATYDKPEGERSMGATVQAFNVVTGNALTEEQGWLFMALLKAVRSQQGAYRADSYEDGAAYFALMGEAAVQERNGGWTDEEIEAAAFKHTPTEHETGEFDLGEPLTKEELSTENWYCLQHDEDAQKALVSLGVQVWDELLWEGGLWECCMLDVNKVAARPYAKGVLGGFMAGHPDLYEIRLINGQFYRA